METIQSVSVTTDSTNVGPLPEFSNPPVHEVAIAVVFKPLQGYTSAHAGLYWQQVLERFDHAQDKQPIAIPPEFEISQAGKEQEIQLVTQPGPRAWLLSKDETEMIQVQHDTYVRNWRKLKMRQTYPRYGYIRRQFEEGFKNFVSFAEQSHLGSPQPLRCELTYVNHVEFSDEINNFGQLEKVLCTSSPLKSQSFLPEAEHNQSSAKFAIRDQNGHFVGRLNVDTHPAFSRADKQRIFVLTLTARGNPIGAGVEGVLDFLDIGHKWIVHGFTDLTTEQMHKVWGRTK